VSRIGATQHMAYDKNTLISCQTLNIGQVVYLANDNAHQICGCGDIFIMLNNGLRKKNSQSIPRPWFNEKIFSIKQFDLLGENFNIKGGCCT
jgi:hypothetical protein